MSAWHERQGGYVESDSAIPGGADYSYSGWRDADVLRAALAGAPQVSGLEVGAIDVLYGAPTGTGWVRHSTPARPASPDAMIQN